jgi:predicted ATPase
MPKVESVQLNGLFGDRSIRIHFDTSAPVSVVAGENGIGKSSTLELLDAVLNFRINAIAHPAFPVDEMTIRFEDSSQFDIQWLLKVGLQIAIDGSGKSRPLVDRLVKMTSTASTGQVTTSTLVVQGLSNFVATSSRPRAGLPYQNGVDVHGRQIFLVEDETRVQSEQKVVVDESFDAISKPFNAVRSRYLSADRMSILQTSRDHSAEKSLNSVVEAIASEMAEYVRGIEEEYLKFPISTKLYSRILQDEVWSPGGDRMDTAEGENLDASLSRLQSLELRIAQLGFLRDSDILQGSGTIQDFLNQGRQLEPSRSKVTMEVIGLLLERHNSIAPRRNMIESLLTNIRNQFEGEKHIVVDPLRGYRVWSVRSKDFVPIASLSSGEKHLLILNHFLMMKEYAIAHSSQILIVDEPELSLHVNWLRSLSKILNSASSEETQIIVATHSPIVSLGFSEAFADLQLNYQRE